LVLWGFSAGAGNGRLKQSKASDSQKVPALSGAFATAAWLAKAGEKGNIRPADYQKEEQQMKPRWTVALSMLVGVALGAAAIQTLHAQAKPPVYMIAINEISNQEGYTKEYVPPAQKSVADHGGVYLAAGPGIQVTGNLPSGPVVILKWASVEALEGWRNSPEFQTALKIGEKYAKFNIITVQGVR
jgi:uncharacterized protein (DUF1330 family)